MKTLTIAALLTLAPTLSLATGWDHARKNTQAMTCAAGTSYDADAKACVPVNSWYIAPARMAGRDGDALDISSLFGGYGRPNVRKEGWNEPANAACPHHAAGPDAARAHHKPPHAQAEGGDHRALPDQRGRGCAPVGSARGAAGDVDHADGSMRYVDRATLVAVVTEFVAELEGMGLTFPHGVVGALTALDGRISPQPPRACARRRACASLATRGSRWAPPIWTIWCLSCWPKARKSPPSCCPSSTSPARPTCSAACPARGRAASPLPCRKPTLSAPAPWTASASRSPRSSAICRPPRSRRDRPAASARSSTPRRRRCATTC